MYSFYEYLLQRDTIDSILAQTEQWINSEYGYDYDWDENYTDSYEEE